MEFAQYFNHNITKMFWFATSLLFMLANAEEYAENYPGYYAYEPNNNTFIKGHIKLPEDARSLRPNFMKESPGTGFKWLSQAKQDMMVLTLFGDKSGGYFVDLAANDFRIYSNTYNMEQFNNWNGLCIEPNPKYLQNLLAFRKCKLFTNPVSAKSNETVRFNIALGPFGGMVGDKLDAEATATDVYYTTTTLTTILDYSHAPRVMEYLSLDVEGAEYYVLQGFDFRKYTFLIVTIERPDVNCHKILSMHGYRFVYRMSSFGECMYLHRSMPNFEGIMNKYRVEEVPVWFTETRPYLLHPHWSSTVADAPAATADATSATVAAEESKDKEVKQ